MCHKNFNLLKGDTKMKKIFYVLAVIICAFSENIYSQTEAPSAMGVSLQAGVSVPMGDFDNVAGLGAGGEATFEYLLNENIGLTGTLGYYEWGSKNDLPQGFDYSFSTVPLLVGGKYFFQLGGFVPYAGAQLGLNFSSLKQTVQVAGVKADQSESSTDFGVSPLVGFRYLMPPNLAFEMTFKYNIISTSGSSANSLAIILGARITL